MASNFLYLLASFLFSVFGVSLISASFSSPFQSLSQSHWFPASSSFSEWHSATSQHRPESVYLVGHQLDSDIHRANQRASWRQQNSVSGNLERPADVERVNLAVGVKHEEVNNRAVELLATLISDPRNIAPSNALSIGTFHKYTVSTGVLQEENFAENEWIMNTFPKLFPRYYGQHLNRAENDLLLTPKMERVKAVENWLKSGGVNLQSDCGLISNTRDYFSCHVTIQQYLRLIPFADIRVYRHRMDSSVRVVKAFPAQPHQLLQHTEAFNPAAVDIRITDAIHYIGGSNRWPLFRPKPGMAVSVESDTALQVDQTKENFHVKNHAQIHSTATSSAGTFVPTTFSADDALMWLESSDKQVLGYVQVRCPQSTDLLYIDVPVHQINCLRGGKNYTFNHIAAYPYWNVQYNNVNPAANELTVGDPYVSNSPHWKTSGVNTTKAAVRINVTLPFNYVSYSLQIELHFQNSAGSVIVAKYNSTRPTTPQQTLHIDMIKTYYRWSETLVNSGSASQYQPQAIGAFWLTLANQGYWAPTDLEEFLLNNGVWNATEVKSAAALVQVVGELSNNPDPSVADGETELDTQWMTGIASNIPTMVYHYNWYNESGFQSLLQNLRNTSDANLPTVLSISYGGSETSTLEGDTAEYDASNILLAALGARGISIFVSSGDNGAYEGFNDYSPFSCSVGFDGSWPSTSPWVTSVGATQLATTQLTVNADNSLYYAPTEVACSVARAALITSGGGFSTLYPQPSYQQTAVSTYLSTAPLPPSSMFNASNRAYPDVSLLGRAFETVTSGDDSWSDGTSASSPSFAAFISNVNQQRIISGQTPLGFLNPILYQLAASNPTSFNDITVGDNACAYGDYDNQATICCPQGFPAVAGYDAVTGLGTPVFDVLGPLLAPQAASGLFTYAGGYASFDGCDSTCFPATVTPTPATTKTASSATLSSGAIAGIVVVTLVVCLVLAYWCCANFNKVKDPPTNGEHVALSA